MLDRPTNPGDAQTRTIPGRFSRSLIALLTCGFASCPFAPDPDPIQAVPSPESPALLDELRGTLLYHTVGSEFHAVDLATGSSRSWELAGRVWALDGPDALGRCVFAIHEDGVVRLVLHDLRTNETTELAEHRGSEPYWEQSAFFDLTLSDDGELTAFRRERDGRTFAEREQPDSGFIEIRTTTGEFVKRFDAGGFSAGLDWRPGHRQLAFGQSVEIDNSTSEFATVDGSKAISLVFLYNLDEGTTTTLCAGAVLGFAPDGEALLVREGADAWFRLDLRTKDRALLDVPGLLHANALLDDGVLLYSGLPTEGAEVGVLRTIQKSPQAMWTLKVADPLNGEFATVLSEVARFHAFSVGAAL